MAIASPEAEPRIIRHQSRQLEGLLENAQIGQASLAGNQGSATGAADRHFFSTQGISRPSDAINASHSERISSSISPGSVTVCATASRSISE
jgi:hypothetical protein